MAHAPSIELDPFPNSETAELMRRALWRVDRDTTPEEAVEIAAELEKLCERWLN